MPAEDVSKQNGHARWDGILCAALWLCTVLAARPFVEAGLIDDFSYVKSAWVFAQTHRLVYNGWATAMIGWQIAWGGIFAAVFGHTYSAVRAANFVTSFATVWLMHATCVRCGLSRRNAMAGTLALAWCPLFLPMSVSFMTDISGLFSVLLCFYSCVRALQAEDDTRAVVWLAVASLSSTVGATARQIAWMSPLVMVPSAAWLLRRRKGAVPAAVVLWLLAAAVMAWSMRWFAHQPLSVPEPLIQGAINLKTIRELVGNMVAAWLCVALVLLPLLAAWTTLRLTLRQVVQMCAASVVLFAVFWRLTAHGLEKGLAPWTGDVLEKIGMLGYHNAWALGVEPSPFTIRTRFVLSVVAIVVGLWFMLTVRCKSVTQQTQRWSVSWHDLSVLLAPFLLAYFALLSPRAMWAFVIDRYLLPPVALAMLVLLLLYQRQVSPRLPARSLALLCVLALFAFAGTHDWIAVHRARVDATARLEAQGVERTAIEAGYETDGMVQIERAGTVVDPRVRYPNGMDVAAYTPPGLTKGCREIFNEHTPVIHARYFLSASTEEPSRTPGDPPCLVLTDIAPQEYTAWMPPFQRRIYILRRP